MRGAYPSWDKKQQKRPYNMATTVNAMMLTSAQMNARDQKGRKKEKRKAKKRAKNE
jgi:hypothetical protein